MTRPSEDSLIARYFAPLAGEGGLSLRDDAARISPRPAHDLVLTVDALVSGVHFLAHHPPASIARKALGVNVSDLAAKGAEPRGFLLSLALPGNWTEAWLADFAEGLGEAARDFGCLLLGGDTVRAETLTLSVTAIGEVPAGRMVPRTGARVGDVICVTGTVGDGALGLCVIPGRSEAEGKGIQSLERKGPGSPSRTAAPSAGDDNWIDGLAPDHRAFLTDRYLHPQPRIALASALRHHANAAMDVSDGLAGDLAKMMRVSGVAAEIDAEAVPRSPAARAAIALAPELMDTVLTGGDDYEILCTVPPERVASFSEQASRAGVPLTPIGRVVEGDALPVFRFGSTEKRYEAGSFSHF